MLALTHICPAVDAVPYEQTRPPLAPNPDSKLPPAWQHQVDCRSHPPRAHLADTPTISPTWSLASTTSSAVGWWADSDARLVNLVAKAEGAIEDAGSAALQLDFANKVIGGGVLRNGSVQASAAMNLTDAPCRVRGG